MKLYSVEAGRHDFKPNDQPLFTRHHRCEFSFILGDSMWYQINDPEYPYGKYDGWNKLGFGLTQCMWSNSRRAVMVAEFPYQLARNQHRIALYVNDKTGNWDATEILIAKAGVQYSGVLEWFRREAILSIWETSRPEKVHSGEIAQARSNWLPMRTIGAWHGGAYPAHKDRSFQAEFQYVK